MPRRSDDTDAPKLRQLIGSPGVAHGMRQA